MAAGARHHGEEPLVSPVPVGIAEIGHHAVRHDEAAVVLEVKTRGDEVHQLVQASGNFGRVEQVKHPEALVHGGVLDTPAPPAFRDQRIAPLPPFRRLGVGGNRRGGIVVRRALNERAVVRAPIGEIVLALRRLADQGFDLGAFGGGEHAAIPQVDVGLRESRKVKAVNRPALPGMPQHFAPGGLDQRRVAGLRVQNGLGVHAVAVARYFGIGLGGNIGKSALPLGDACLEIAQEQLLESPGIGLGARARRRGPGTLERKGRFGVPLGHDTGSSRPGASRHPVRIRIAG